MRISTLVTLIAFAAVGLARGGDMRAIWSAAAWLGGFEIAYQSTALAMRSFSHPAAAPGLIGIGLVFVWLARRRAVRPMLALAVPVAALWLIWIALGFHANLTDRSVPFSVRDEVLNEAAKTLWALAYLLPLWGSAGLRLRHAQHEGLRSRRAPV